jgi:hypothetical protein
MAGLLEGKSYLIVLDDMSSTTEWDAVVEYFPTDVTTSRIIVTTREENICRHYSKKERNIHKLELLQDEDVKKLFTVPHKSSPISEKNQLILIFGKRKKFKQTNFEMKHQPQNRPSLSPSVISLRCRFLD